jgi:hypothetical protein
MEWLSPGSSKEGMLGLKDTYTVRNQAFKNPHERMWMKNI